MPTPAFYGQFHSILAHPMDLLTPLLIIAITPGVPNLQRYAQAEQVFFCDFRDSWDKNFDAWPDGWSRRRGPGSPHFVSVQISKEPSPGKNRCLRIDLDSAAAIAYSPAVEIDPLFSYVLEGRLKTEGLSHDRAMISLTFLDAKRRRLETYYSRLVQHSNGWKKIHIGPVAPQNEQARRAVVGLHLQPQGGRYAAEEPGREFRKPVTPDDMLDEFAEDLNGTALFDDLWLGRLPRVELSTNAANGIFPAGDAKRPRVRCRVSGFPQKSPRVTFLLEDHQGRQIAKRQCDLDTSDASHRAAQGLLVASESIDAFSSEAAGRVGTAFWEPPVDKPGFYRVRAELEGYEYLSTLHNDSQSTFVVMSHRPSAPNGQFGWSLVQVESPLSLAELPRLLSQMGVGFVKYPLWYGSGCSEEEIEQLYRFAEQLDSLGIALVGVLDKPPPEVAVALGEDQRLRAAEVFTAAADAWAPTLAAVLTRLAGRVQWWQLGDDRDVSFVECVDLHAKISEVKARLDRIDHDIELGIVWDCRHRLPARRQEQAWRFISLVADPPLDHTQLDDYLRRGRLAAASESRAGETPRRLTAGNALETKTPASKSQLSIVLQPLTVDSGDTATRINDLVQSMAAAKINGVDAVTIGDVFDARSGLFDAKGMPGELLLPWCVTAQMLQGCSFLGQIQLPNHSQNRVFCRGDEIVMLVWSDEPCDEVICLGEDVCQIDVWGRETTPPPDGHRQVIRVGPMPSFVVGLNKNLCLWRMAFELQKPRIASMPGKLQRNRCCLKNSFAGEVVGRLQLVADDSWKIQPEQLPLRLAAGEHGEAGFSLRLPYDVIAGAYDVRVDCTLKADRLWNFSVYRSLQVGLGDVFIEHATEFDDEGNLRVDQRFVNEGPGQVSFRCGLSAPGRQRMTTQLYNMPAGSDLKTYVLPQAKELIGKTLWLRGAEIGGRRRLNYKFTLEDQGG